MKNENYMSVIILLILVLVGGYYWGKSSISNNSNTSGSDLFSYERLSDLTYSSNPITNSTTCSFKKVFNVFYKTDFSTMQTSSSTKIYYNFAKDNESDTVSFTDLNTIYPKAVINGKQAKLTTINDNDNTMSLFVSDNFGNQGIYKIYKKTKLLIYIDNLEVLMPHGTLEMGYCN